MQYYLLPIHTQTQSSPTLFNVEIKVCYITGKVVVLGTVVVSGEVPVVPGI